jgi:hypothetical protein
MVIASFALLNSTDCHIPNSFWTRASRGLVALSNPPGCFSRVGRFQVVPTLFRQRPPQSALATNQTS